ncbi:MAG: acetate--CoA ligase [Sedimentisphaerales bacterium]|nr:acetate--CoA ligase [Sedimentisphaerales bacterium]
MSEEVSTIPTYDVPDAIKGKTDIDFAKYQEMYDRSVKDPEGFWSEMAEKMISWDKKWDKVLDWDFHEANIEWFKGGKLNVSYNCLDRHVEAGKGDQTAIIWEGNDPHEDSKVTYKELLDQVCQFANALKKIGVKKGDRVCMYMQMVPQLPVAMLACTRIGAVHSIVFGAFSPDSLAERINDSECKVIITQDTALRGKKNDIPMKTNADKAAASCPCVEHIVVVKRTGNEVPMQAGRDLWWHEMCDAESTECACESMDAEDPLFILYTSGSTGHPKGVLHTTGGYLLYAAITHKYVFDYQEGDIYWCTADIGWVTGHSYIVYGPLTNRAVTVMFEGVPNYPDYGRFWEVVDKHKVNIFYTAPTALRALMKEGDSWVTKHNLSTLKVLGTVGEPIKSPEWHWYYQVVGKENCPIVDTWWQTETGGILITPLPGAIKTKPGSATLPFFGVQPELVDENGKTIEGNSVSGNLCIKFPWPGMMRTLYGDHDRFKQTYFSMYPGKYFSGDGCRRDEDGYYWITGRVDDVINVSGHRLGTAEIEGALGKHPSVAEAAVVGMPHDLKGQGIYAYVTLKTGKEVTPELKGELVKTVRNEIGPHASPDKIQFTPALPKTRSGKIMRRILRKISEGTPDQIGDTSTLADPSVVDALVTGSADA